MNNEFEIKEGQIWKIQNQNITEINCITLKYEQYGHDYETGGQYAEEWVCGVDNNGHTFNCMARQFIDEIAYNNGILVAEYPTWQEAVNSKVFK